MDSRTDARDLRNVLRAVRAYPTRDVRVASPCAYVYRLDLHGCDAVVEVRRSVVGWIADVWQDGAPNGDGTNAREQIADVRVPWSDDVRVVVYGAIAAADALRFDLDDVDDELDALDVADMLDTFNR